VFMRLTVLCLSNRACADNGARSISPLEQPPGDLPVAGAASHFVPMEGLASRPFGDSVLGKLMMVLGHSSFGAVRAVVRTFLEHGNAMRPRTDPAAGRLYHSNAGLLWRRRSNIADPLEAANNAATVDATARQTVWSKCA
jgi:carbonic anhydrase